ncbi:MAG TPA: ATP-binding cassette domain-containing protein [Vicinamibacterales bacterium]|nr:ATP-binding cassette domain-containing protein [Vicinamibacterales bacterium]
MRLVLDFTLRQGPFRLEIRERVEARAVGLFGPSGAGKTTVLDAVAGLRRPEAGEIRIGDRVLFSSSAGIDLPSHRRRVGYVPQDLALFPHLDARRNVLYGARRGRGLPVERVLELLEIAPLAARRIGELSGGERQRVALARALVSGPDVLLFDEPLASVDVALRRRLLPHLRRIRDELGVPLVYVTHDAAELAAVADWVLVLDGGRVVRSAPVEAFARGAS